MKRSGIYSITNKLTGKTYIGQSNDIDYRFKRHKDVVLKNKKQYCYHVHNAMRKYGVDNFEFKVLVLVEGKEMLDLLEARIIAGFNTLAPKGYNLDTGGTNRKYSNYKKKKMSKRVPWNKGMKFELAEDVKKMRSENMIKQNKLRAGEKRTEEQKRAHSEKMKGRAAWNKGMPLSEEQKAKLRATDKSYKQTEEFQTKHKAGVAKYWENYHKQKQAAIALG